MYFSLSVSLILAALAVACEGCKDPGSKPLACAAMTQQDRQLILNIHNEYRRKVTQDGPQAMNGPMPKGKRVPDLIWNDELEKTAQDHANNCVDKHFFPTVAKFNNWPISGVGQNLFAYRNTTPNTGKYWTDAIAVWYNEIKFFDINNVDPFNGALDCAHFTQVISGMTTEIGCSRSCYEVKAYKFPYQQLYVCNYGPAGNTAVDFGNGTQTRLYETEKNTNQDNSVNDGGDDVDNKTPNEQAVQENPTDTVPQSQSVQVSQERYNEILEVLGMTNNKNEPVELTQEQYDQALKIINSRN